MKTTRRSILKAAPALLLAPVVTKQSMAQGVAQAWAGKVSPAVVRGLANSALTMNRKSAAGKLTGGDLRNLATSAGIFFDHLEEIGASTDIERQFKSPNPPRPQSYEQFTKLRRQAENLGAVIDDVAFNRTLLLQQSGVGELNSMVAKYGIAAVHANVVASLKQQADNFDRQYGVPVAGRSSGTFIPVQGCGYLAILGVYFATWGALDALAIIAIPGIGVGLAVIGVPIAIYTAVFC